MGSLDNNSVAPEATRCNVVVGQTMGPRQMWTQAEILQVLDDCCESFTFPMLDNGYVYLAATRMSLHRSADDWAVVIEVFGFSPRSGLPDVHVHTFGSRLHNRSKPSDYVSKGAYEKYIRANPHNESRFFYPIDEGPWQDTETFELVSPEASEITVRGRVITMPSLADFQARGIDLEEAPRIQIFELCRLLAAIHRADVLATPEERRVSVPPDVKEIMVLDEWNHPNVVEDERPSTSETFQQIADVLVSNALDKYRPSASPNTHWSHWPDGGSL